MVEVGDGAGEFEYAVVCACGESVACHGAAEECGGGGVGGAVEAYLAWGHLRVAVYARCVGEALCLDLACVDDACADGGAVFGWAGVVEVGEWDGGDFDVHVDSVEEWS